MATNTHTSLYNADVRKNKLYVSYCKNLAVTGNADKGYNGVGCPGNSPGANKNHDGFCNFNLYIRLIYTYTKKISDDLKQ